MSNSTEFVEREMKIHLFWTTVTDRWNWHFRRHFRIIDRRGWRVLLLKHVWERGVPHHILRLELLEGVRRRHSDKHLEYKYSPIFVAEILGEMKIIPNATHFGGLYQ